VKKFFIYLAVVLVFLNINLSSIALAIDVYVDTETKQLYIEPGPGRTRIGTLKLDEQVETENPAQPQKHVQPKVAKTDPKEHHVPAEKVLSSSEKSDGSKPRIALKKGAFGFETEDGNFNFSVGGRIHAQAAFSNHDHFVDGVGDAFEANDGTEIRRGRLKFEGTFYKDWYVKSEVDFADNKVAIKDMFLQYHGLGFARFRVGEQKQAFSRELQESSNDLLFIERSVMNVLNEPTVDRALGFNVFSQGESVFGVGEAWTGQVGIYGDTIEANKRNTLADEGWAVNTRVTFAPIARKDKVIHLGIAGNYRQPNDAGDISDAPLTYGYETSHLSNLNLLRSRITNVDDIKMLGIEGHGLYGPFSAGGEYTHSWIDTKQSPDLNFHGWYTEAAWTLTGESRVYKSGLFRRVSPNSTFNFRNRGWGAWELAARYGEVDLNDDAFKGGKLGNLTVGLNWYPNDIIRFMASYDRVLKVQDSPLSKPNGDDAKGMETFMFRAQLTF